MKSMIQNRGIAIPVVFGFITMITITAIMLMRTNRQDLPQSFQNLKHLQMKYVAKGAQQHARTKMKLMSTQAYDAAAYAVGKNPVYDHSGGSYAGLSRGAGVLGINDISSQGASGLVTNPGPAFFTGTVNTADFSRPKNEIFLTAQGGTATYTDAPLAEDSFLFDNRDISADPDVPYPNTLVTNLALVRFYEDISTTDPRTTDARCGYRPIHRMSQCAMRIASGTIAGLTQQNPAVTNPDPVTGMPDLFSASYRVTEMRVLASKGAKLYGEEAVLVKVRVDMYTKGFFGDDSVAVLAGDESVQSGGAAILKDVTGLYEETAVYRVTRTLN